MTPEARRVARLGCALNAQPTAAFLADGTLTWEERWERLRTTGEVRRPDPERWLAVASERSLRFVVPEDAEWPTALDDLGPAARERSTDDDRRHGRHLGVPFGLWLRGRPLDTRRSVAVVGARAATDYGLSVAADLAMGVVERDVAVVSGAAYGIDAAAHRGALAGAGRRSRSSVAASTSPTPPPTRGCCIASPRRARSSASFRPAPTRGVSRSCSATD